MTKEQLINQRFGKWLVIDVVGDDLNYRTAKCSCVCDCGTKRDVSMHCLIYKQSKSCGCTGREVSRRLSQCRPTVRDNRKISALYSFYKSGSKIKRPMDFTLTPEEFYGIVTKPCHYCGSTTSSAKFGMGIDRVDNLVGYVFDNCVPCCKQCNKAKNTLTVQEFYDHIRKIHEFQKSKLETFNAYWRI